MRRSRLLALVVLVPFLLYSTWATATEGFAIYFTGPFTHRIWTQEFLDLCIALTIVSGWMLADGRRRGLRVWPYVVLVPLLGSIAPLCYLVFRKGEDRAADPSA